MKTKLAVLVLFLTNLAFGQNAGPRDAFSLQKTAVALPTGITLKYIDTGSRQGVPVILLHGGTDSGRSFQQVIDELSAINKNLRIIAPDLRGHGESSMPDAGKCAATPERCFGPAEFASDIIALMDALEIPRAHIVGHSMGSVIAQELALHNAGRVNSLVLIGTFVNGKECPAIRDFLVGELIEKNWRAALESRPGFQWPADAWLLTADDAGPVVQDFLKDMWVVDPAAEDSFIRAIYPETARVPLGVWIGIMKGLVQMDNREALKNLKKPTLILWATQDNFFPETPDQQWVKEAFESAARANGTQVVYKIYGKAPLPASGMQETDLGHNLHWGAPKAVAADIASFIESGMPLKGLPYANPTNIKQVLTDEAAMNIVIRGKHTSLEK